MTQKNQTPTRDTALSAKHSCELCGSGNCLGYGCAYRHPEHSDLTWAQKRRISTDVANATEGDEWRCLECGADLDGADVREASGCPCGSPYPHKA